MSTLPAAVVWCVRPLQTPAILRRCARCDDKRPFVSSDRFRINAQGRRLDIWLIYRCLQCEYTWNRAIHSRIRPEELSPNQYEAYRYNDVKMAWDAAFALRSKNMVPVDEFALDVSHTAQHIRLSVPWPVTVRLDRVLARGLERSRSQICTALRSGFIRIEGQSSRPSASPVDGASIWLSTKLIR